jgi:hypothetical protein
MAVTSCINKDIYGLADNLFFMFFRKVLLFPPP